MFRIAEYWETASDDLNRLVPQFERVHSTVREVLEGEAARAFDDEFRKLFTGDTSADKLAEAMAALGDAAKKAGQDIEHTKLIIITTLAITAAQIAYALAMAVWTAGASLGWAALAEAGAIGAIRMIAAQLIENIAAKLALTAGMTGVKALAWNGAKGALIGLGQNLGQEALIQQYQMNRGHRDGFDGGKLWESAATGAAGGAGGALAGHGLGKVPGLSGGSTPLTQGIKGAVTGAGSGMAGNVTGGLTSVAFDGKLSDVFTKESLIGGAAMGGVPGAVHGVAGGTLAGATGGHQTTDAGGAQQHSAGSNATPTSQHSTVASSTAPAGHPSAGPGGAQQHSSGTGPAQISQNSGVASPTAPPGSHGPSGGHPSDGGGVKPPTQSHSAAGPATGAAPAQDAGTHAGGARSDTSGTAPAAQPPAASAPSGTAPSAGAGGGMAGSTPTAAASATPTAAGSSHAGLSQAGPPSGARIESPATGSSTQPAGMPVARVADNAVTPAAATSAGDVRSGSGPAEVPSRPAPVADRPPVRDAAAPPREAPAPPRDAALPRDGAAPPREAPTPPRDAPAPRDVAPPRDVPPPRDSQTPAREAPQQPRESSPARDSQQPVRENPRAGLEPARDGHLPVGDGHPVRDARPTIDAQQPRPSVDQAAPRSEHTTPPQTHPTDAAPAHPTERAADHSGTRPDESPVRPASKPHDTARPSDSGRTPPDNDARPSTSHDGVDPPIVGGSVPVGAEHGPPRGTHTRAEALTPKSKIADTAPAGRDRVAGPEGAEHDRAGPSARDGSHDERDVSSPGPGDKALTGGPGPDDVPPTRPDPIDAVMPVLERYGATLDDLKAINELAAVVGRDKLADVCTTEQLRMVFEARMAHPHPGPGDVIQKVIPEAGVKSILEQAANPGSEYGGGGRYKADEVSGCVSVASDAAGLQTPSELLRGLRLDYGNGSPYEVFTTTDHVYVIEGRVNRDAEFSVPNGRIAEHLGIVDPNTKDLLDGDPPHTGTGYTGDGHGLNPEYQLENGRWKPGAQLFRIDPDGSRHPVARLEDKNTWVSIKEPADHVVDGWPVHEGGDWVFPESPQHGPHPDPVDGPVHRGSDPDGQPLGTGPPIRPDGELAAESRVFARSAFDTEAGAAFFDPADAAMRSAADHVPPAAGEFTIDVHGDAHAVSVWDGAGTEHRLPAHEFAEVIRHNTGWDGQAPIRLLSCDTGNGAHPFAADLARELGVPVSAPDRPVWTFPDGREPVVTGFDRGPNGELTPRIPPDGQWNHFGPDGLPAEGHSPADHSQRTDAAGRHSGDDDRAATPRGADEGTQPAKYGEQRIDRIRELVDEFRENRAQAMDLEHPDSAHTARPDQLDEVHPGDRHESLFDGSDLSPDERQALREVWEDLSADQRRYLYTVEPMFGEHAGLPVDVCDHHARQAAHDLRSDLISDIEMRRNINGDPMITVDELSRLRVLDDLLESVKQHDGQPPRYLLGFEHDGRSITAVGNPDTASHTVVFAPGTFTSHHALNPYPERAGVKNWFGAMDRFEKPGYMEVCRRIHEQLSDKFNSDHVAVVDYQKYHAPQSLVNPVTGAPNARFAHDGAAELRNHCDRLQFTNQVADHQLWVAGHSYGTVLVGEAAQGGHGLNADGIINLGSPGLRVADVSGLILKGEHLNPGDAPVHTMTRSDDPIRVVDKARQLHLDALGIGHGLMPHHREFGGQVWDADGVAHRDPHNAYFDRGNVALRNIADIVAGGEPPPPQATHAAMDEPGDARRQAAYDAGLIDDAGRVPVEELDSGERTRGWPYDDTGYRIRGEDLRFLGLDDTQVSWWQRFEAPLGMTPEQFREFTGTLRDALVADGIDPAQADIRMQGSSAQFFSGPHKDFPTEHDLAGQPEALARLREWMGDRPEADRPARIPFDAKHLLGMNDERGVPEPPSDYDIQFSSDAMVEKARQTWEAMDPETRKPLINPEYDFVRKKVVEEAFPELYAWKALWEEKLGREVAPAVFGSAGPPDKTGVGSGISTHFRDSDWLINRPGGHRR